MPLKTVPRDVPNESLPAPTLSIAKSKEETVLKKECHLYTSARVFIEVG